MKDQHDGWVSTAHGGSHRRGGGDELSPADIGAVSADELADAALTAGATAIATLAARLDALEAALNVHVAKKAGQAHK